MKKKLVALMLGAVMAVSALSGCGTEPASETEASQTSESKVTESSISESTESAEPEEIAVDAFAGTEIEVAVIMHSGDKGDSYADKPAIKMAEEATGIKVNFIEIESGTGPDRINMMLASGEMPDAFVGMVNDSTLASNLDLFYDLSEEGLLETYAPDVLADYEKIDNAMNLITWGDGSIRSLLMGKAESYDNDAEGIMVINKTWLDKLGMDIPETADEFYEVMCAFRDNDMNGNGDTTDEIPLEFCDKNWADKFVNFANSFGIAGNANSYDDIYLMVKDGVVTPTVNTDEFRAWLEYYHMLAEEKILDIEGFSQTQDQYDAKIKAGLVGCYHTWTPKEEVSDEYVAMKPFQALEGVEPVKSGTRNKFQGVDNFVISADTENVEAVLHWWNYLSSSLEMKWTYSHGPKGELWDIDENGKVYEKEMENIPGGLSAIEYQYTVGVADYSPIKTGDDMPEIDHSAVRTQMVDTVWDMLQTEVMVDRFLSPEKNEEKVLMETDMKEYMKSFIATSVLEGITDESWNAHLEKLEDLDLDKYVSWYQDYYDGKF